MGRVFTYQEIVDGRYPEPETFQSAKKVFEKNITPAIEHGEIDGAILFGSVAIDKATTRSDLDILLVLSQGKARSYMAARAITQSLQRAADQKIPIVPGVYNRDALLTGRHEIDRFFGRHLSGPYRVAYGNDPANYINFAPRSGQEILGGYLAHKKRRLSQTYVANQPLNTAEGGLQRMLELPMAVGRKAIAAFGEAQLLANPVENTADKGAVLDQSQNLFQAYGAEPGFRRLVNANQDYDELLGDTMTRRVSKLAYEKAVQDLHHQLPDAIKWIEQIERQLLPALDHAEMVR